MVDIPPNGLIYASVPLTERLYYIVLTNSTPQTSYLSFHNNFVPYWIVESPRERKYGTITKRQFQELTYKSVSKENHLNKVFWHRR